jgi:Peptidase A4 family
VGETVKPGDSISASVTRSGTKYTMKVTDSTTSGNSFTASDTCAASTCKNQSAEWIAEAPSTSSGEVALPNFGTWTLSSATVKAGSKSGTIKSFPDDEITMKDSSPKNEAQPGALNSKGNSFKDVWKA